MNTVYAAALADEHRARLQAEARQARLCREIGRPGGSRIVLRIPRRLAVAFLRPRVVGGPRFA